MGCVAVAFAVGDLVDPDGGDTVKIAVFQAEIDDPFYRTADRVPVKDFIARKVLGSRSPLGALKPRLLTILRSPTLCSRSKTHRDRWGRRTAEPESHLEFQNRSG